jgi:hypothetical protein
VLLIKFAIIANSTATQSISGALNQSHVVFSGQWPIIGRHG